MVMDNLNKENNTKFLDIRTLKIYINSTNEEVISGCKILVGTMLRIEAEVLNHSDVDQNCKLEFLIDRFNEGKWDHKFTTKYQLILAKSSYTYSYKFTPRALGNYLKAVNIRVKNEVNTASWEWTQSFSVYSEPEINSIEFAGISWIVKSGVKGPGPNNWLNSPKSIWVDELGKLHLKIRKINGIWYSAEIFSQKSFGYGEYKFKIESNVEKYDPNVVCGLFIYKDDENEIDIEFSKWGKAHLNSGLFIIQPPSPQSRKDFPLGLTGSYSTHRFIWSQDKIDFQSWHGSADEPAKNKLIAEWTYQGDNIPRQNDEKLRINFWLMKGKAPIDGKEIEMVISKASYSDISNN